MKRFMVLCLTVVFSVWFVACGERKEDEATEVVVSSGSFQAQVTGSACVIVQSAQLAALTVKKGDFVLCNNAEAGNKCIKQEAEGDTQDTAAIRVVWNARSSKLEKKSGLNCKPLEESKAAEGQGDAAAAGQQQTTPAAAGQQGAAPSAAGGEQQAAPAAPAASGTQAPAEQQGAGQEQPESGGEQQQQEGGSQPESGGGGEPAQAS